MSFFKLKNRDVGYFIVNLPLSKLPNLVLLSESETIQVVLSYFTSTKYIKMCKYCKIWLTTFIFPVNKKYCVPKSHRIFFCDIMIIFVVAYFFLIFDFFLSTAKVMEHMAIHNEDRPFLCCECGKGYKTMVQLRNHEILHKKTEDVCKIS